MSNHHSEEPARPEKMAASDWSRQWRQWADVVGPGLRDRLADRWRDKQLVEEAVGDALTDAWLKGHNTTGYFKSQAHFTGWVTKTARSRVRWRFRRKRDRLLSLDELKEEGRERVAKGRRTSPALFRSCGSPGRRDEDRELAWRYVEKADAEDRDLLVARYWKGQSALKQARSSDTNAGTKEAQALRRRRLKAEQRCGLRLVAAGVEPADWGARAGKWPPD